MNEVAEGINTALAVKNLAARLSVEMPITDQICGVLYEHKSPRDAAFELMSRPLREE
jgi:glycerol-3-phosphate dehydrogenase (NAD(P)+)